MDDDDLSPEVVDEVDNDRFVVEQDGAVAELVYELDGDRLLLIHTGVPEELGGRGIAGRLVDRRRGPGRPGTVSPSPPGVPTPAAGCTDHPDAVAGVTIDWSEPPAIRE